MCNMCRTSCSNVLLKKKSFRRFCFIVLSFLPSRRTEKDLRFLRIGSLNVRVKRTTEAFSNFLGVGHNAEKIHKTWGSADNIQQVYYNYVRLYGVDNLSIIKNIY